MFVESAALCIFEDRVWNWAYSLFLPFIYFTEHFKINIAVLILG